MIELLKDEIAAMRAATSFAVRINTDNLGRGEAQLTVYKEIADRDRPRKDGYAEPSDRRELSRDINGKADQRSTAYFHVSYARSQGNWQALCQIVRPGDLLRFYTDSGNENDYLRAAEIPAGKLTYAPSDAYDRIYLDELRVDVIRPRKGSEKRIIEGFLLTFQITPQNSARAVKPAPRDGYSLTA